MKSYISISVPNFALWIYDLESVAPASLMALSLGGTCASWHVMLAVVCISVIIHARDGETL